MSVAIESELAADVAAAQAELDAFVGAIRRRVQHEQAELEALSLESEHLRAVTGWRADTNELSGYVELSTTNRNVGAHRDGVALPEEWHHGWTFKGEIGRVMGTVDWSVHERATAESALAQWIAWREVVRERLRAAAEERRTAPEQVERD